MRPATTCSVHSSLFIEAVFQVNTSWSLCHIWRHLMKVSTDCYLFHSCGHLARGAGQPVATCCLSEVLDVWETLEILQCEQYQYPFVEKMLEIDQSQVCKLGGMVVSGKCAYYVSSLPKTHSKRNVPVLFKHNSIAIGYFLSLVTSLRFYISCHLLPRPCVPAAQKLLWRKCSVTSKRQVFIISSYRSK